MLMCPGSHLVILRMADSWHPNAFRRPLAIALLAAAFTACTDDPVSPGSERARLVAEVRRLAHQRSLTPIEGAPTVRQELVTLGQALAFDKILSGNRDIACMTCHLPGLATGDGRALSIGQGGTGLGPGRSHAQGTFIPRNSPPVFNLHRMRTLFWDGRVEELADGSIQTPAGDQLTPEMQRVFEFGAVSAQAMFPVQSRIEMRGPGNELAQVPDDSLTALWSRMMDRLAAIPEYRQLFAEAYLGTAVEDMSFAHASNAMAGFFNATYAFTGSPWDRFLAGDDDQLGDAALRGARAFMTVGCTNCHETPEFQSNPGNEFHNVALAQFGPGKGDGPSGHDDFGRERVTHNPLDRRRFVTRPLRNIELTAPYGHLGQFRTLKAFVEHYNDVDAQLLRYDIRSNVVDPALWPTMMDNFSDILANRDKRLLAIRFDEATANDIVAFLHALTDDAARDLRATIPARVPSGLPIDRMH